MQAHKGRYQDVISLIISYDSAIILLMEKLFNITVYTRCAQKIFLCETKNSKYSLKEEYSLEVVCPISSSKLL